MASINNRILLVSAWLCVPVLAYLSLVPDDFQARTSAPGYIEHFVAYCGTAVLFALRYPQRRIQVGIFLVTYSFVLELLQNFSPGRVSRILDACVSGSGAIIGVAVIALFTGRYWQPASR
ncbi:VanZ family protein [Microvirga sp. 3-52]|jgi:VanZ family protein|uniref:VanZ family protein n=1 Tax=Microvirga sp. 3-52 TaxID=2792425 RepID=UPI001ACBA383|nr:VanZ family protein [Microvirga sp. 3-52]MBS7454548.1 VanZ family protein [Microvirga sp. 3-52]